ncbi:hypothetical protein EYF80_038384 [Liparis tanakae]|uniref:Uncharacterized protein n=1 Tax=Liparis tanakae TaxID=230148 RepID=A0A4Z2GDZ0_9TELE|nr:hypothetical protein EYF80_038384 [Liparis tanakae]
MTEWSASLAVGRRASDLLVSLYMVHAQGFDSRPRGRRPRGLTVQLPLDEVHAVRDLVLDRVDVVQQVDLPLLMLPAVIGGLSRVSLALVPRLRLGPGAAHRSLEMKRRRRRRRSSRRDFHDSRRCSRSSSSSVLLMLSSSSEPCRVSTTSLCSTAG